MVVVLGAPRSQVQAEELGRGISGGGTGLVVGTAAALWAVKKATNPANKPPSRLRREGLWGVIVGYSNELGCWESIVVSQILSLIYGTSGRHFFPFFSGN